MIWKKKKTVSFDKVFNVTLYGKKKSFSQCIKNKNFPVKYYVIVWLRNKVPQYCTSAQEGKYSWEKNKPLRPPILHLVAEFKKLLVKDRNLLKKYDI